MRTDVIDDAPRQAGTCRRRRPRSTGRWTRLVVVLAAAVSLDEGGRVAAEDGPDAAKLFAAASPAVVKIVTFDGAGVERGSGSGFVVSEDGWVATNFHVVRGAHAARVQLASGAGFSVEGVGPTSADWDTALLKVSGRGLAALQLAVGEPPAIGTRVFAIGAPQGLSNTLSDGLISAYRPLSDLLDSVAGQRSRSPTASAGVPLIQTTAAISPGSSGGPLLLADGTVIGITTLQVRGGQNLNFAVPVTQLRDMLKLRGTLRPLERLADEDDEDDTDAVRWKAGAVTVSVRMPPANPDPTARWTVGSTMSEVLSIEGAPTAVTVSKAGTVSFFFASGEP